MADTHSNSTSSTSTSTPAAAPEAPAAEFELSAADLAALERDMQTKPASEVVLPDGRKLSEVLATRATAEQAEGVVNSAKRVESLTRETSAVLPANHRVTITARGELIVVPLSDAPATPPADSAPETATDKPAETPLPPNFPSRHDLVGGGLDTVEKVTAASDDELIALPHIDVVSVRRIRAAQSIEK